MTPEEQDKELRGRVESIFKNPHCQSCHEDWDYDSSYRNDSCCTRFMTDSISKVVELITADRKRVALEAKIEVCDKYLSFRAASDAEYEAIQWLDFQRDELHAELKAKQEEV